MRLPTLGMSDRLCPGCEVWIVRRDLSLSSCAPGTPLNCANCSAPPNTASSAARERGTRADVLHPSTPALPISPATVAATHSSTPTVSSQLSKRRASTPSPFITPASKSHYPIINPPEQANGEQANRGALATHLFFDPAAQGTINSKAPSCFRIYMYGFARAHEQTQIATSGLHARIDSVEPSLKNNDTHHKAEFADIRIQIAGTTKTVDDSSIKEDPCEVVVRGLPPVLALTNKQITTTLLVALQLPDYAHHVVSWREWSPKRRSAQAQPAHQGTVQALEIRHNRTSINSQSVVSLSPPLLPSCVIPSLEDATSA